MKQTPFICLVWALLVFGAQLRPAQAEDITIAVAANFAAPMKAMAVAFGEESGHTVRVSVGSSGKLYAQILHGAPYDAFFSADESLPKLLEEKGLGIRGTRYTYARGKLVLWSPNTDLVDPEGNILSQPNRFSHLAVANPKLAPYGRAAVEFLKRKGLFKGLREKLVFGENINQAYHFVQSGAADLGFVAYSHIRDLDDFGSHWLPPLSDYTPVVQQAIILKSSPEVLQFIEFTKRDASSALIRSFGYEVSEENAEH